MNRHGADEPLVRRVFTALADGADHSGEQIAALAGVSRSAVWKAIERLRELGLDVEAATNRGYRLKSACEALDAARIAALAPDCEVHVEWSLSSTNATLLAAPAPAPGSCVALLTENQTGGRGRRGRRWRASLGGSLALSIATTYEILPRDLPALTLAMGCCVRRALGERGAEGVRLKWPNDLWIEDRKLGGILVELRAEAGGPGHVVFGVGLNLSLSAVERAEIAGLGTEATDLASLGVDVAARNALAAAVIAHCCAGLRRFGREGFTPFAAEWRAADALRDRPVSVSDGAREQRGVARGIDTDGALQLERDDGRIVRIVAGEVSVRTRGAA
mgnify:FL=1